MWRKEFAGSVPTSEKATLSPAESGNPNGSGVASRGAQTPYPHRVTRSTDTPNAMVRWPVEGPDTAPDSSGYMALDDQCHSTLLHPVLCYAVLQGGFPWT